MLREGEVWLRPILTVRERGEIRLAQVALDFDPMAEGRAQQPDRFLVDHRIYVGADARWRFLRAYVVLRDARQFGTGSTLRSGGTDLFQAFAELHADEGWLRIGRQEIAYAGERLVGRRPWSPGQSFDAIRGHLDLGALSLDGFGAWISPQVGGDDSQLGRILSGFELRYVTSGAFVFDLEAYYLYDDRGPGAASDLGGLGPTGPADRRHEGTLGLRVHGADSGLRYDAQVFGQVGERFDDALHVAFAGRAWLGYDFGGEAGFKLRGGGSFGTGESRNGTIDTFDFDLGTNHGPYGIVDNAGLSNMGNGFLRLTLSPRGSKLTVWGEGHVFLMPEPNRPWYGQNNRVLAQVRANGDPLLGGEVDLVATWRPDPALTLQLGYGLFIPGDGAEVLGVTQVSQFLYLSLEARLP